MTWLIRVIQKLSILGHRKRFDQELEEEMAFHKSEAEKEFTASGMSNEAARLAAARQFGNTTRFKQVSHEVVGFSVESVLLDIRFAFRQLRKNPGFSITAVLILALGLSASTAIFAFVDAALIKPLPYPEANRLVQIDERGANFPQSPLSYPDFVDWKQRNTVFKSMDVYRNAGYLLKTAHGTEPVPAAEVSATFFRTLGIAPLLGRDFRPDEDRLGAAPVALLAYHTWQDRFSSSPSVVGQQVTLSGVSRTIIGVLPPSFEFAPRDNAEFWVALQPTSECTQRRSCHNLDGIARLKDGVSISTALAGMQSIAAQLERQYPDSNRDQQASVIPLAEAFTGSIRTILFVLLAGACLLLVIACVNVSSLLVVRSESRRREISVRGALGASPARLVRQFITEGAVLVAAGSACGLGLASLAISVLHRAISKDLIVKMPYLEGIGLNLHLLLFAGALSLLAALLFALTPILHLSFSNLRDGLTEGARGSAGMLWRRLGANMVVIELATAMVLLVGAGLLVKSLYRLLHVDLGFTAEHLATIEVALPEAHFSKDEQVVAFARKMLDRVSALPGVQSAAITSTLPVSCNCNTDWIRFVGRPYDGVHIEVNERDVSAGFFTTLRARLLQGRFFTDAEDASKPKVVVVNKAFVRKFFPGEDPLGKRFGNTDLSPGSLKQIVGVVDDIKDSALDQEHWPAVYYPFNQTTDTFFSVLVRTSQDPANFLPNLAQTIKNLDPEIGARNEMTLTRRINDSASSWLHRSSAWLVASFAALALTLSIVGLYGVIAYSVSQRTREIGVRMALGANRGSIYSMVLREAAKLTATGIAVGALCGIGAATFMRKLLFGVSSWDVPTLLGVSVLLAIAAVAAGYLPARRAASVNPMEALRAE